MAVNTSLFTEYSADEECTSIKQCKSFKRICHILSFYQSISDDNNNDMNQIENFIINYIETNKYKHIISDFHHILIEHLNHATLDDNCLNYDLINKLCSKYVSCNIVNCQFYIRNGRDREIEPQYNNKKRDKNAQVIMEVLDNIHTYFMHGYDTGFRVHYDLLKFDNKSNNADENDEKAAIIYTDTVMSNLSNQLKIKRNALIKQRGLSRVENNKFVTKVDTDIQNIDEKIDVKTEEISDIEYSFGTNYYYWEWYKDNQEIDTIGNPGYVYNDWYVKAKYKNMKKDVLKFISYVEYENTKNRAEKLLDSDFLKQMKSHDCNYPYVYITDLYPKEILGVENVMSIIFYTDYTKMSAVFSATFRRMTSKESNKQMKIRHSEVAQWSKVLIETIKFWGQKLKRDKLPILYHGVSYVYFHSFQKTFAGPTSMTRQLSVAAIFASTNGLIVELTPSAGSSFGSILFQKITLLKTYPYYFNCSLLSAFSNEDERLFIAGCRIEYELRIDNIRNVSKMEQYGAFMKALSLFHSIIIGLEPEIYCGYSTNCTREYKIINILINQKFNNDNKKIPTYITKSFDKFLKNVKEVKLRFGHFQNYSAFRQLFINDAQHYTEDIPSECDILQINSICRLFPNCKSIFFDLWGNGKYMSYTILSENRSLGISKMLNNTTKLKKLILSICKFNNDTLHDKEDNNNKMTIEKCRLLFTENNCDWNIEKGKTERGWTEIIFSNNKLKNQVEYLSIDDAKEKKGDNKEKFLSDKDFFYVFEITKDEFYKLPLWKQKQQKKRKGFF